MIDKIIENLYLGDVHDVLDEFAIEHVKNELKVCYFCYLYFICLLPYCQVKLFF